MSTERIMKQDRIIVMLGLLGITAISWIYMFNMAGGVMNMDQVSSACCDLPARAWSPLDLFLIFSMWTIMMTAMMVPSESPTVLMFAAVNRERQMRQQPFVSTGMFLLGYLAAWTIFSALAALTQWGLQATALLSGAMAVNSSIIGGALLSFAGIFQWTRLKYACLSRCRSPLGFLMNEWREGASGAFIMGFKRGVYCIGCCWLLMGLMFVAGVMSLLWMVIITLVTFLEKVVPGGFWISRIAGLVLVVWGMWMVLGPIF